MGLILNPIGEDAGGSVARFDLHRCGKGVGRLRGRVCVRVCCFLDVNPLKYKYVQVRSFVSQSGMVWAWPWHHYSFPRSKLPT